MISEKLELDFKFHLTRKKCHEGLEKTESARDQMAFYFIRLQELIVIKKVAKIVLNEILMKLFSNL